MIQIDDVYVTFNPGTVIETRALRGLALSIPKGQFVTMIGSNGSGKSTLLNVLAGEVPVDSGRICVGDEDVTGRPASERAGLVSRVFQDPMAGTCEALTIEENLALAQQRGHRRRLKRAIGDDLREKFRERLASLGLGLEMRLQDRMGLLSGGQRQAVSLVMATLQPMKILLLDEHTAALDPKTASFVMGLTDRFVEEDNLTALLVTHSMRQALDHGMRTIMLHEGQVVLDVADGKREGLDVADFLQMFENVRGDELADDSLLLG